MQIYVNFLATVIVLCVLVYFGYIVLKRGWGWVLAQWHARVQRLQAAASTQASLAGTPARVAKLESQLAALAAHTAFKLPG